MTVEIVPVESWADPEWPVTGASPYPDQIHTNVIHYVGAGGRVPADEIPQWLRNGNKSYWQNRGYALGYNWALSQDDGLLYEIRGDNYRNAANKGGKIPTGNFNSYSQSVLVVTGAGDPVTPVAVATLRQFLARHPQRPIIGHRDVEWTTCCGDEIYGQIQAGVFAPETLPPEPPPTAPEGAPEMFLLVVTNGPDSPVAETWLVCDGTQLGHVVDGHAVPAYEAAGVEWIRSTGADQTRGLILSSRTTNGCPPEWRGTAWETLWEGQAI